MSRATVCAFVPSQPELVDRLRNDRLVVPDTKDLRGWVERLQDTGPVVIVGEQRHERPLLSAAAALSDAGLSVATRLLPHGPAAVVLVAREAAYAPVDAGVVPALVDAIAAETWSGAWTASVVGLTSPAPSLGQHVASWFRPRHGFVVTLSEASGRAVTSARATRPRTGQGWPVLTVAHGQAPDGARADLLRTVGASETVAPDWLVLDPVERFGTPRALEAAALPANSAALLSALGPVTGECTVCGSSLLEKFCPYCRVAPVLMSPAGGTL